MTDILHAHISLLEDVKRKIQAIDHYSATKFKLLMDLKERELIVIDDRLVVISEKGHQFIKELEYQANEYLNNHG